MCYEIDENNWKIRINIFYNSKWCTPFPYQKYKKDQMKFQQLNKNKFNERLTFFFKNLALDNTSKWL